MEIILAIITCAILFVLVNKFVFYKNKNLEIKRVEEEVENEKINWSKMTYPLEQRLRNLIFEAENSLKKCLNKMNEVYQNQLDLVRDLGRKSHVEVKNKACFFEYKNPISKEHFFYYERDLYPNEDKNILIETKKILSVYTKELDLLKTQQIFFEQLICSHQENLDKLNEVTKGNTQLEKINKHRQNTKTLKAGEQLEEEGLYQELLLEDIKEELNYQEDCMKEYVLLQKKHGGIGEESNYQDFKLEIKEMIKLMEEK